MKRRTGMTLIEMLIAMTVFLGVMGVALQFLRIQSETFRAGTVASAAVQNLRFASDHLRQDLRIAGANVPDQQPVLVYASASAIAINADYATNVGGTVFAVYHDPEAPNGQVSALTFADRLTLPGSSPAVQYPDTTYRVSGTNSDAETIMFFFALDATTARPDDYVLRRQVNGGTPETVARGILPVSGTPFFSYDRLERTASGALQTTAVPAAWLPLRHTRPIHLSPTDTGAAARIDSVRAVRVTFDVTNGLTGADERRYRASFAVPLPNMGLAKLRSCGDIPLLSGGLSASVDATGSAPVVRLSWNASPDEAGGERDVARYVLWRRISGATTWGDPYLSIPAGNASYLYVDAAVESGTSYQYAMAAQDCTPTLSSQAVSVAVIVP